MSFITKYMRFVLSEQKTKTQVWQVLDVHDGSLLGTIRWFGRWRQYAFMPEDNTVYSASCLADIESFILSLMNQRKEAKESESSPTGCNREMPA